MTASACGLRYILRRDRRIWIGMCLDGMNAVAVGAHRSLPIPLRHSGSVNALLEFPGDGVVALAASERDIKFEDGRLGIFSVKNFMRAMAIGADGGFFRTVGYGMPMHALLVRSDHLRALAAVGHYKLLAVACAAGSRNVGVTHAGFRIAAGSSSCGLPWQSMQVAAFAFPP